MKKIAVAILGIFAFTSLAFAQPQYPPQDQNLQVAREGCQKAIGYFPTPSKLMCILTAFGLSQKDVKPKALATVFSVCHGRPLQPQPASFVPKKYPNLGSCLKDPAAIELINKELNAQGFPAIKVVHPGVLATTT